MSNIAVQGGATGTGTVTILAPSTSTSRTLTLPDSTGTIAAASSGTADATTFLRGDGVWATVGGVSTGDIVYTSQPLTAPDYLPANGLVYSQASYPALYALVGTLYPLASGATATAIGFGGTNVNGFAFGAGLYVAVGGAGKLLSSPDAITWTSRTSSFGTTEINAVTFNSGTFVAVAYAGKIATSTDGINWTQRTSSFGASDIYTIAFGAGVFVAVGDAGKIATSPDGTTWTQQTSGFGASVIVKVFFGNGLFVAGGAAGKVATSPDGITWTQRTLPGVGTEDVFRGAFGLGKYLVYSSQYNGWQSFDGVTWVSVGRISVTGGVEFSGKTFISSGPDGTVSSSLDGINWETFQAVVSPYSISVIGNSVFVGNYYGSLYKFTYRYDPTTQFAAPNAQAGNVGALAYVKT